MEASEAAKNALKNVLEAVAGEIILIVCDDEKMEVGKAFSNGSLALGLWTRIITLQTTKKGRIEVPERLLEIFAQHKPDIYINVLQDIREETPFRIKL